MPVFLIPIISWWKDKAWPAIKKYGLWVIPIFGIVAYLLRKKDTAPVVAPELVEASEAIRKEDDKARVAEKAAQDEMYQKITEIESSRAEKIAATEASVEGSMKLQDDPQGLNDYLLETGKKMRDKT